MAETDLLLLGAVAPPPGRRSEGRGSSHKPTAHQLRLLQEGCFQLALLEVSRNRASDHGEGAGRCRCSLLFVCWSIADDGGAARPGTLLPRGSAPRCRLRIAQYEGIGGSTGRGKQRRQCHVLFSSLLGYSFLRRPCPCAYRRHRRWSPSFSPHLASSPPSLKATQQFVLHRTSL